MDASQYPITEGFGCQPGYPLNQNLCPRGQGFHNGIDYGCPIGTPVIVNGVAIGFSGDTGYVTGPHLHVGRWVGGVVTDPGVKKGFQFNNAVVTEIHTDPNNENGKYVRIQGDGASWVYLHLSQINVNINQELKGSNMSAEDQQYAKIGRLFSDVKKLSEGVITMQATKTPTRVWDLDTYPNWQSHFSYNTGDKFDVIAYLDYLGNRYYISAPDLCNGKVWGVNGKDVKVISSKKVI